MRALCIPRRIGIDSPQHFLGLRGRGQGSDSRERAPLRGGEGGGRGHALIIPLGMCCSNARA